MAESGKEREGTVCRYLCGFSKCSNPFSGKIEALSEMQRVVSLWCSSRISPSLPLSCSLIVLFFVVSLYPN